MSEDSKVHAEDSFDKDVQSFPSINSESGADEYTPVDLSTSPRGEKGPLTKPEIDLAFKVINDKYPLNYLSVFEVFSLHKIFKGWVKHDPTKIASNKLREEMMERVLLAYADQTQEEDEMLELKRNESTKVRDAVSKAKEASDEMIRRDPLNLLGLGIVAQFALNKFLIFGFIIFTLLSIPIIYLYTRYDAMRGRQGTFGYTTLANFGFSSSA